jgi:cardiolipin synthase
MNLTAANQLTILRMLLIPAFVILLLYEYRGWALTTFLVAGLTDLLDGLIARLTGQKTTLGAWLDPMADKLLLVTMFVVLTLPGIGSANRLPVWFTVLVISRDVAIVLTVAVVNLAVGRRTFRPSMFGKIATATYIMTGVVALYYNYLGVTSTVVTVFVYGSLAITLLSAFDYAIHVLRLGRAPERTGGLTEGSEAEIETTAGLRPGHEGTKARRTRRNLH